MEEKGENIGETIGEKIGENIEHLSFSIFICNEILVCKDIQAKNCCARRYIPF